MFVCVRNDGDIVFVDVILIWFTACVCSSLSHC